MANSYQSARPEVSIVLPCRNEAAALGDCLKLINNIISQHQLSAEVIVSDSSTDNSPAIAKAYGAKLIKHDQVGYGRAYLEGFKAASGQYIIMADADGTYDFNHIPEFLAALKTGYDMVIGDRFAGQMTDGAMPWLHRYIGNPILSGLVRIFYGRSVRDVHCGLRAINRPSLDQLNLQTTGMEFASEMVIKAIKQNLTIKQIPINYHRRLGQSKLRSFRDGWRHLRFILLYSPLLLFFLPGLILFTIGTLAMAWLYFGQPIIAGRELFFHPMFIAAALMIAGWQIIIFAGFAKIYAITHLKDKHSVIEKLFQYITLEKASLAGLIITIAGISFYLLIFWRWWTADFGDLNEITNAIIGLTLLVIGLQTIFSAFMLSVLGIKEK